MNKKYSKMKKSTDINLSDPHLTEHKKKKNSSNYVQNIHLYT